LFLQLAESADDFARFNAGSKSEARMAMTAMTTSNSMSVNAGPLVNLLPGPELLTGSNSR
jgi:hypothetical protein